MANHASGDQHNPLDLPPALEERIRGRAYHLWEADGRPAGRDEEFWERARILEAMESSSGAGQTASHAPEAVEEAVLQDNLGEFPDRLADQSEHRGAPMTRAQAKLQARRS